MKKENKSNQIQKVKKIKVLFYQFNELNSSTKDFDIKALLINNKKRNKGDNIFIEKLNFPFIEILYLLFW